jgi:hypothetical protein
MTLSRYNTPSYQYTNHVFNNTTLILCNYMLRPTAHQDRLPPGSLGDPAPGRDMTFESASCLHTCKDAHSNFSLLRRICTL